MSDALKASDIYKKNLWYFKMNDLIALPTGLALRPN
jgi:hypothetical protein